MKPNIFVAPKSEDEDQYKIWMDQECGSWDSSMLCEDMYKFKTVYKLYKL